MTLENNKASVRRFYQAFEQNDQQALRSILSEDCVAHNLDPQNCSEHLAGINAWHTMFSDNRFEILSQVEEGDTVVSHVKLYSTHSKAPYQGITPTGKQIEIPALSLERFRAGKIVERWVFSDRLGMMRQLGLVPQPVTAA